MGAPGSQAPCRAEELACGETIKPCAERSRDKRWREQVLVFPGPHCSEVQLCPAFSLFDHLIFFLDFVSESVPLWPQLVQVAFLSLAT